MVWCEALWIHRGSTPGPGEQEFAIWEFQSLWPTAVPRERPGKGTARAGDRAGSREQPGATAWREGQRERIDQICSNPEACSKYWINVKTPRVGRERPLPTKKQSPVLHVNTFLRDSQRQLVQVKNNRDWQLVQSSPPLTVRVSQN